MNKKWLNIFVIVLMVSLFAGCSKGGENESKPVENTNPVTLKVLVSVSLNDEDFQMLFVDPLKKKYPYITLERIETGNGVNLQSMITAGSVPDIIIVPQAGLSKQKDADLLGDIAPLIKSNHMDLNRFDQASLDAAKLDGILYGLPLTTNFTALFYNKDLFDKFAVPYPKEGLTWDETTDLAKKLTRQDGGVQYKGLDPSGINLLSFPLALTYVDAKTNKASVNNDLWKQVFTTAKEILTIPGNEPSAGGDKPKATTTRFLKDQNVAMSATINILTFFDQNTKLNWDVTQFPTYKERPGVTGKVDAAIMAITKTSQYQDQAMKILDVVTSDEVQLQSVRKTMRVSPLKNPELQKQFGADQPFLKGKNIQAVFKGKVVAAPEYSEYSGLAQNIAYNQFDEYLTGAKDLNTALRDSEELINQMLASQQGK